MSKAPERILDWKAYGSDWDILRLLCFELGMRHSLLFQPRFITEFCPRGSCRRHRLCLGPMTARLRGGTTLSRNALDMAVGPDCLWARGVKPYYLIDDEASAIDAGIALCTAGADSPGPLWTEMRRACSRVSALIGITGELVGDIMAAEAAWRASGARTAAGMIGTARRPPRPQAGAASLPAGAAGG